MAKNWWDFFSLNNRKNNRSDPAIGGDEGQRAIASGTLDKVFSLLQRPAAGVAGSFYNLGDDDPQTSFSQGLLDGLQGRTQHNWSDILGQHGVTNPIVRAIGGFAGDVALDPLTYTGLKYEKGANLFEEMANVARQVEKETIKRSPQETEMLIAQRVADIQRENPASLYATFAGKRITPKIASVPNAAKMTKDYLIGSEGARRVIPKAVSMESEHPFGLWEQKRKIDSAQSADYATGIDQIDKHFGFLTDDQAHSITMAIENNESLGDVPTDWNGSDPIPGLEKLDNVKMLAQSLMHDMGDKEVAVGQLKYEQMKPNYIPRYYPVTPDAYPNLSRAASVRTRRFEIDAQRREYDRRPLEHLLKAKPEHRPETNIGNVLKQRTASHYRKVGRGRYVIEAVDKFGVKWTPENADFLRKNGYRRVGAEGGLASETAKNLFADSNIYLPQEIISPLNAAEELLTDNNVGGNLLRKFDSFNRKFKFMNTVVSPGYWIRNAMSDFVANVANGVDNPKFYMQAKDILRQNSDNATAKWMNEALDGGMARGYITPQMYDSAKHTPGVHTKINLNGEQIGTDQAWERFLKEGGKTGEITSSGLKMPDPEEAAAWNHFLRANISKAAEKSTSASAKLARWGAYREDLFRLAHFLSATEKNMKKGMSFEDATLPAGQRVRHFGIDYGKLSKTEKQVARRAIPFYPWMRRNLPLQVELLFTRPGFMALYPKGQDLLQGMLGTDDGSGDKIIPEWIRNSLPVRMAMGGKEATNPLEKAIRWGAGAKANESVFMPLISATLPAGDLANITDPIQKFQNAGGLTHPAKAIQEAGSELFRKGLNQSTPAIKMPAELAFGRSAFTGGPIKDWGPWIFGQTVPGRAGYNISQSASGRGMSGIVSTALGVNLQPVTQERQKGEAQRRKDVIENRDLNEQEQWQEYLRELRRIVGEPVAEESVFDRARRPIKGYQRVTRTGST